jgi:ABC-type multidrug transport system ATPase subunit
LFFWGETGGKIHLAAVIARIVKPNVGRVYVCGIDVLKNPENIRSRLGFVAHSSFLYRHLTAFENLLFSPSCIKCGILRAASGNLHWVGLEKQAHRQIRWVFSRMQQRLAIARPFFMAEILLWMSRSRA